VLLAAADKTRTLPELAIFSLFLILPLSWPSFLYVHRAGKQRRLRELGASGIREWLWQRFVRETFQVLTIIGRTFSGQKLRDTQSFGNRPVTSIADIARRCCPTLVHLTRPTAATQWMQWRDALCRVRCGCVDARAITSAESGHDGAWPSRSPNNMRITRTSYAVSTPMRPAAAAKWKLWRDALCRVRKCPPADGHDGAWPSRSPKNMRAKRADVTP